MNTTAEPLNQFKVNQLISGALIAGILVFIAVGFTVQENYTWDYDPDDFILPLSFLLLVFGAAAALFLVKSLVIPGENNLIAKVGNYQTRTIAHMAFLEAPAVLAIFLFISIGCLWYLMIPFFSICFMLYLFPGKNKFISEYELSFEEKRILDKMN